MTTNASNVCSRPPPDAESAFLGWNFQRRQFALRAFAFVTISVARVGRIGGQKQPPIEPRLD